MATVSEDLLLEGKDLLTKQSAEDIHRFGDRILSVEPDNWYGHYMRGCAFAIEADVTNSMKHLKTFAQGLDDEQMMADLCPGIAMAMARCMVSLTDPRGLDFSHVGELVGIVNSKLPESEDEYLLNAVFDIGIGYMKEGSPLNPLLTFHSYKALVVTAFRAYVELSIMIGLFEKIVIVKDTLSALGDPALNKALDANMDFINEMIAVMRDAVDDCPPDRLDKIEEYWLEHKVEPYLAHIFQAYQMSGTAAGGGRFLGKMAKKVMSTEILTFIKVYLSPKVE